jgi:hypothetical protein
MHDQSEYLERAERFEALAEETAHEQLKPLYRQLAAQYRNLAAAIAGMADVHPQVGSRSAS